MKTGLTIDQINRNTNLQQEAAIRRSSDLRPKVAMRLEIDLTEARTAQTPMVVFQPFNGFYVEETTDTTTEIKFSLGSVDKYNTDNYTTIKRNDAGYSPEEIKAACLFWDAQAGKTLVIVFYVGVEFRPGSLLNVLSGAVTVSDGDSLSSAKLAGDVATIACAGGVATPILAADADRKVNYLYIDAPAWIGDSSVQANVRGVLYQSGLVEWRSPAAAYLWPVGGVVNVFGNDFR